MAHRNELAIWVFHLKRGGGHAVVNWIARNLDREVFHLNNAFSKPFKVRWRGKKIFRRISDPHRWGGRGRRLFNVELPENADWREVAQLPKQVLLTNVENYALEGVPGEALFVEGGEHIIGRTRRRRTVLVLRDAPNTFASVWSGKRRMRKRLSTFYREQWKTYAREFLGRTGYLPADTVKVSFNRWFTDDAYRRRLAAELGLDHAHRGLDDVPTDGGGSSFTGTDFEGRAREMAVLDRWRRCLEDPEYVAAFDRETLELSTTIFGDVSRGLLATRLDGSRDG